MNRNLPHSPRLPILLLPLLLLSGFILAAPSIHGSAAPQSQAAVTPAPGPLTPREIASFGRGELGGLLRSPGGRYVFWKEPDKLHVVDTNTNQEIKVIEKAGPTSEVNVSFSPDGRLGAVAGYSGLTVFELPDPRPAPNVYANLANSPMVDSVAYSPDFHYTVFVGREHYTSYDPYHLGLWNNTQDKEEFRYPVRPYPNSEEKQDWLYYMGSPAVSPDGKWVAAGGDKTVYIWDLLSGKIQFELEGHGSDVTGVAFSPDGHTLASASADGTARLWDPLTGKLLRVITGFANDLTGIQFVKNGRALLVDVKDFPRQVVDLASGRISPAEAPTVPDPFAQTLHKQGFTDPQNNVLYSPDGKLLAVGGQSISLWDPATQTLIRVLESARGNILRWAFSPDSRWLAALTDQGLVLVWDARDGRLAQTLKCDVTLPIELESYEPELAPRGLAFSPSGDRLAFGSGSAVEVWSIPAWKRLGAISLDNVQNGSSFYASRVSFSSDGAQLALEVNNGQDIWIADAGTYQVLRRLNLPSLQPRRISGIGLLWPWFARNNSDGQNNSTELWNLETGKMTLLPSQNGWLNTVSFSRDGRLLAVVNWDTLSFYQLATGQLIFVHAVEKGIADLDLSPDGGTLALGLRSFSPSTYGSDRSASLWDIRAISAAARQPLAQPFALPSPTPILTPAPASSAAATPIPTLQVIPRATPVLGSQALSPANADKIAPLASYSRGFVQQARWLGTGGYLVTAAQGAYIEGQKPAQFTPNGQSYSAAVLPGGEVRAALVHQGRVQVWSTNRKTPLFDRPGRKPALSPDGRWLIYGVTDQVMRLVELRSGKVTADLRVPWPLGRGGVLWDDNAYYDQPLFSPDSSLVAVLRRDLSIRVWDVRTGKVVYGVGITSMPISGYAFSANGAFITAAAGGSAWLWDLHARTPPQRFQIFPDNTGIAYPDSPPPNPLVTSAVFDPARHLLAIGTNQGDILLVDTITQKQIRKISGLVKTPSQLAFSPDGSALLSVTTSGMLDTWEVATGKNLSHQAEYNGQPRGLSFRLDGDLSVWTDNAGQVLSAPDLQLKETTLVPTGTFFAASPDGKHIAVSDLFTIQVWDTTNTFNRRTMEGATNWADYWGFKKFDLSAAFSPDGSLLAVSGTGGTRIDDPVTRKELAWVHGSQHDWTVFSPDSRWLIACCDNTSLYDVATGDYRNNLETGSLHTAQAAFSPDNRQAAGVLNDWDERYSGSPSRLVAWNLATGAQVKSLEFPGQRLSSSGWRLSSLAYSPDGRLIAVGNASGQIALVDSARFQVITTFEAHEGAVLFLAFSTDGRTLASAGKDGKIRTWGVR